MISKPSGVRTTHPEYDRMLPLWEKCANAAEGEHAIHAAGEKYLPRLAEETDKDYAARKARTPFFNAFWRTVSGLKGMLFRKDPQVEAASIKAYIDDVDMAGTTLESLAQEICEEVLTTGRMGILCDYPQVAVDAGMTVAQVSALGLRPILLQYKALTIINWKVARINNALQLVLVVLKESADVSGADEFAQKREDRYRVLDISEGKYRQRVFRIDDKGNDELLSEVFPVRSSKNLDFIPFFIFSADHLGAHIESPPLLDLAEINIHHYQVSADWEHGCHFSGLPTLFITGYRAGENGDGKIYIGGTAANGLADPTAKAFYAEVQGGFEALKANLDGKKAEMAVLGARMLEGQKASVESAETLQQRAAGEQSQLAAMANTISMGITKALTVFAEWAGASGKVEYQINKDFIPAGLTSQDLTALVGAWQSGAISGQVLFENLQKGEIIKQDDTYEEEQERIAAAPPNLTNEPQPEPAE